MEIIVLEIQWGEKQIWKWLYYRYIGHDVIANAYTILQMQIY